MQKNYKFEARLGYTARSHQKEGREEGKEGGRNGGRKGGEGLRNFKELRSSTSFHRDAYIHRQSLIYKKGL
jgi:hypothetical protein